MSEAVKNRQAQRERLRQIQQEQAQRKRELAAQQREDMRTLKEYYTDQAKEIDSESSAAVNHINTSAQENSEQLRTYNRKGRVKESDVAIQNYSTKKTDQFYKVMDRGSRIKEGSDGYTIEAYSPEHEKDQVRITVHNNKAIVSGHRKFQDTAEQEDKKVTTSNYQSFREEFKFSQPVAAEGMRQERAGDFVRVFVPKLAGIDFSESEDS